MPYSSKAFFASFAIIILVIATAFYKNGKEPIRSAAGPAASPKKIPVFASKKIRIAILLDVSNSMDGLIGQAKAQLWNMVSVLGKAKCDGMSQQIEITLYEYGRSSNNRNKRYVQAGNVCILERT